MAQRNAEAAASGGTVLGAPAGGQKVLSTLSGMELVQVALKQVRRTAMWMCGDQAGISFKACMCRSLGQPYRYFHSWR